MRADVAVLIVSYNTEDELVGCLESVRDERRDVRQQVVVVDNASQDASVARTRELFPEVDLVASDTNLGFAAGVNLAASRTDADYLLLLNPDTVVLDHAIDTLVEFARTHPGHGLYGGRTVQRDGSLERSSCWGLPTLWSTFTWATGLSSLARGNRILDPESLGSWQRDTVREVGIVTGCLLLIERAAWQRLEGFDERYFMYGEDADLALRARAAGYRPIICPDAQIVHDVGLASASRAAKLLLLFRGKATIIHRHWAQPRRSLGLAALLGGVALRALARRARGGRTPATNDWAVVWHARRDWIGGFPAPTRPTSVPDETPTVDPGPAEEVSAGRR